MLSDRLDPLVEAVSASMATLPFPLFHLTPESLGSAQLTLGDGAFFLDGRPIGGILFRARPGGTYSAGFSLDDRPFCDAEISAVMLAAIHLDSVCSINRYDAAAWYEGAGWSVWRARLEEAGVPVSPITFGDAAPDDLYWYSYAALLPQPALEPVVHRMLGSAVTACVANGKNFFVCGQLISGQPSPAVIQAASVLRENGVALVEITADEEGRVLIVDTSPAVSDAQDLARAGELLALEYGTHLRSW